MVVVFEEGNIMNKKLLTKTPVVCGLAIICCLLWGSAFPCIKIGYQMFNIPSGAVGSQFLFAGIRFTLAGILTILFGSLLSKKILVPKKESLFSVFKLSMVQTVLQYVFFYIGLANTSGVKSSIINAANVFLSILFAVFIFKYEKMTVLKVLGCDMHPKMICTPKVRHFWRCIFLWQRKGKNIENTRQNSNYLL